MCNFNVFGGCYQNRCCHNNYYGNVGGNIFANGCGCGRGIDRYGENHYEVIRHEKDEIIRFDRYHEGHLNGYNNGGCYSCCGRYPYYCL